MSPSFPPAVTAFDRWADDRLERWRGHRVIDAVFTTASRLGEFSLIWHLAAVIRGLANPGKLRQVPTLALLIGLESLTVNQGVKRLFGRARPTPSGDDRYDLRTPLTSSFPSGHASAAAFTATVVTGWDGRRAAPLWWSLALTVAVSRAYVRVHHASDVVAGLGTGAALGVAARRVLARRTRAARNLAGLR